MTNHFKVRVDARKVRDNFTGLEGMTYQEIADLLATAVIETTFKPTERYRRVTIGGKTFGIGFKIEGKTIIAATFLGTQELRKDDRRLGPSKTLRVIPFAKIPFYAAA